MKKVHWKFFVGGVLCGQYQAELVSSQKNRVTCKKCLKVINDVAGDALPPFKQKHGLDK